MIRRGLDWRGGVLLRLPNWLGDVVALEPLVQQLAARAAEPERLTLVAPAPLLALVAPSAPGAKLLAAGKDHRAWAGHGTAILLTGSWRSAWMALAAGIPRRVGYARDGRRWLLTDGFEPAREGGGRALGGGPPPGPWAPRFAPRPLLASALELCGALGLAFEDRAPRLGRDREAEARAGARLERAGFVGRPLALLNVGGRPGSAKALAPEMWAEVARQLGAAGLAVAAAAGPGEEDALAAFARGAPAALALVAPLADLGEFTALARRAAVVLTTDSGPRHLATAVGAPRVVLFGPTDPRHTRAGPGAHVELRESVPCGPCHLERCPLPGARERVCLTSIGAARIAAAALGLLSSSPHPHPDSP